MSIFTKLFPAWIVASLTVNGLLGSVAMGTFMKTRNVTFGPLNHYAALQLPSEPTEASVSEQLSSASVDDMGPRHKLSYQEWVELLRLEADAAATNQPEHLAVLAGDSISLWFPPYLLPDRHHWLNQGISGETSAGLLKRLDLLDEVKPETIFLMIGINDLIRGISDETILANQQAIIRRLKKVHPKTEIVVQSVLPHGAENLTWEGRDRLLQISNQQIRELNRRLAVIAEDESVQYLDLYTLFADADGDLLPMLTTDGLHLNQQGYLVWRTALQMYSPTTGVSDGEDE